MSKDKISQEVISPNGAAEPARLPGLETVGVLPAEVVRKAIHRRLSLKEALPDDPDFKRRYRFLWEWLTFSDLSDEKCKERATLIIKVSEGAWSMAITDNSMAASLAVSRQTLDLCLQAMDEALANPEASWVPSRKKEAKLKERKKK